MQKFGWFREDTALHFAREALPLLVGRLYLLRRYSRSDNAIQRRVPRTVNLAHASGTDRLHDLARAETPSFLESHGRTVSGPALFWRLLQHG